MDFLVNPNNMWKNKRHSKRCNLLSIYSFKKKLNTYTEHIGMWKAIKSLFSLTALLNYNSHTVQFTHFKCTIQRFFKTYSHNCVTSPQSILEHFITPQRNPTAVSSHHLQPLATTNLVSVSTGLPSLKIAYTQNHTICGLCDWLPSSSTEFPRLIQFHS